MLSPNQRAMAQELTFKSLKSQRTGTRWYFSSDPKGIDATMDRTVRNHKQLSIESIRRNRRISRKRSLVEYPYAVMKRMFHFSHVMVTLARRVRGKFMFACFGYNVHALKILHG